MKHKRRFVEDDVMARESHIPKFICSRCDKEKPETECFCEECVSEIVKSNKKFDKIIKNE